MKATQIAQQLFKSLQLQLHSRSVISVHGRDSAKFLNGLCTQIIPTPQDGGRYAAILSPPGRMLYDTFIYPTSADCFYLDVDSRVSAGVVALCNKYKLRSKVKVEGVEGVGVYWKDEGGVGEQEQEQEQEHHQIASIASMIDPRAPGMGRRILAESRDARDARDEHSAHSTHPEYSRRRYSLGVPEGIDDLWPEKSLPLESNIDYMNGVNFRKGCYVGQELTIRTQHTGVVRKRILPITLQRRQNEGDTPTPPPMTNIYAQLPSLKTPKQVGKLCGTLPNPDGSISGIALLRLEMLVRAPDGLFIRGDSGNDPHWHVQARIPEWWPNDPKLDGVLREAEMGDQTQ
ncbi:hypothetical protein E3P78_00739 [Wallemia ichthyophaga]|nr:hypothetical protein E3P98_00355 [Wallemia ichthyophaga]TIB65225.1 hypothetical protein E3P78_00739 [Wallemia ichthyophaga]